MIDECGLYITIAQMGFFINRKNGQKLFDSASPEFMKYYRNCCLYNLVFDMMEEDPKCGKMYWDTKTESVAIAFPMNGKIAKALATVSLHLAEIEDEEGMDEFESFD